ncbi:hypothetical protein PVK06_028666 [Gossypium arboreum]|uniref:Reverse transcriptase zinc-binding domain-containing protein n=1 Tax=Gossypium arboreum TaxID=29729 RepID=A0ABR0P3Q2_GOSAR|nr:hypothetical protein PVK06_028666 [Gossypium arboreum]
MFDDGLLWRIGSGEKVNIWNDAWLPSFGSGRLLVYAIDTCWSTVNQLIDAILGIWNREVICKIVDGEQASRILKIPITGSSVPNMLVWRHDASGEYSVKSGYRSLLSKKTQFTNSNLNTNDNSKLLYKSLWELQLPSKIKIHMWRLLNDYVPDFLNLARRELRVDTGCRLCKEAPKDIHHILWSYNVLRHLWHLLNLVLDTRMNTSEGRTQFVDIYSVVLFHLT